MKPLWGVVPLTLTGLLYLQWAGWPPPPSWQLPPTAPPATEPGEDVFAELEPLVGQDVHQDRSAYAEVIERPLFLPDRRPPEPEASEELAPEAAEATSLEELDLVAVIMTPDTTTAWVKNGSEPKLIKVQLGEDVAGWMVRDIRPDRLDLESDGVTNTLLLRTFQAEAAAPERQRRVPQRRPRARQPTRSTQSDR
ncbi:hypothetical protein Thimo_0053 [Thioflavicoccus mobilis 8321]|uniref:Type II secretion system protein GspC N-terminal domain-containing protein n=1 Tax=Thioflavicoccus mobilis 8321 TaxID=765912 RepID=L0GU83_9GAMM|nr:hypothetical protein [Thioflavicoccus mobilis]AGA88930.1 hypothetical protein Thimo_0053 [Thioflavicoccus mobilis 8321]